MTSEFQYIVKCPYPNCGKGEVRSDSCIKARISVICDKCHRAFIADWDMIKSYPSTKIKRK